jgi:hypothetical protein
MGGCGTACEIELGGESALGDGSGVAFFRPTLNDLDRNTPPRISLDGAVPQLAQPTRARPSLQPITPGTSAAGMGRLMK